MKRVLTLFVYFSLFVSEIHATELTEVPISCSGYGYEKKSYVIKSGPENCLEVDDRKVCETKWYSRIWGPSKSADLASVEGRVTFKNFHANREVAKFRDGTSREICDLKFEIQAGGRSVACRYSRLTKVIAVFCEGSEPWLYRSNEGPRMFSVSKKVGEDGLNFRQKPSLRSAVITRIKADSSGLRNLKGFIDNSGKLIPVDESFDRASYSEPYWCRVRHEGKSGWVACRYLQ